MEVSLSFTRIFFVVLSVLFASVFALEILTEMPQMMRILMGVVSGVCFASLLVCLEIFVKYFNLRTLNILSLGLLFGCFLGYAVVFVLNGVIEISGISLQALSYSVLKTAIYLTGAYFGLALTARSSEQLYISIPFMKFKPVKEKKKDVIIDSSILYDTRIIDLAASGLLDHHLVIPRFLLREIQDILENGDETNKAKARRALDVLRRLEDLDQLAIRYVDTDFMEVKESATKIVRLARILDANIITADINRIQQSAIESTEGIRIINIHILSNALKPITQTGEHIQIKIQRYGKESRQGVGYLEDGTMVVVNGGADFLGEIIKAQVLSVKHTSSGRMIFCNALEEEMVGASNGNEVNGHKNYFSI